MRTMQTDGAAHSAGLRYQRGVGFGGWLVIEPWMFPNMVLAHQPMDSALPRDDPTLSQTQAVYVNNVNKYFGPVAAVQSMANHYAHFISSDDLDALYCYGITHVRVPVGYWLFQKPTKFVYDDETCVRACVRACV